MIDLAELNRLRRLSRMRRAVVTAGQLHEEEAPEGSKGAMVTLTYRPEVHWRRQHISECLAAWRTEFRGDTFRYVWVLELTKKGKPHYHVLIWIPRGRKLRKPDTSEAWPWGMTRVEWARNAVGYLVKYATKGTDDCKFPRGARLYGMGGLTRKSRESVGWSVLPRYIREQVEPSHRVARCPGGGWICKETGEFYRAVNLRECYA